ncbi:MAG: chemotaxis protein CheW [Pirellulaceae bacterium]
MAAKKTGKVASRTATPRRGRKPEGASPNQQAASVPLPVDDAAAQAAAEWQRTFDVVSDPMAILDPQYRIVRVNKALAERLGLAKDQCVGETCYRLVHGSDEPPSYCPQAELLRDGEEHTVEIHEERLAGDFRVTVAPIRDAAGCLVGSVHIARDITRCVQAERALHEATQQLNLLRGSADAAVTVEAPPGNQGSSVAQEPPVPARDAAEQSGLLQLISFKLGNATYGIEITKIREILLVGEITRVPETLPYVKGLINLRSIVVPVIDLRLRFSLADTELTPDSRILVLCAGSRTIGIVVDSVNQVLRVPRQDIVPAPSTVTSPGNEYMTGLVRLHEGLLILLDVDRLFGDEATLGISPLLGKG